MKLPVLLAAAVLMFLVVSCSQDPEKVTGGGSEIPNEVAGAVISLDQGPAEGARVLLVSGAFNPDSISTASFGMSNSIVDTAYADDAGSFAFTGVEEGDYYIEVLAKGGGGIDVSNPFTVTDDPDAEYDIGNLRLTRPAVLRGRLYSGESVKDLLLTGTHSRAEVANDGTFFFPALWRGMYRLTAAYADNDRKLLLPPFVVTMGAGDTATLDSLVLDRDVITLFNFEDDDPRNLLRGIAFSEDKTGVGNWYVSRDTELGGGSEVLPDGFPAAYSDALESAGAYQGRSLHVRFNMGPYFTDRNGVNHAPYASIGLELGDRHYDFTGMEQLTFYARGSGSVRVQFISDIPAGSGGHMEYEFTLSPAWNKVTVTPGDIRFVLSTVQVSDEWSWDEVKSRINIISFLTQEDTDLWLDDIRFVGLTYDDF
jgi:hypothetical protein